MASACLHRENGVAACDLPLTVSAVTGEAIADLDGTEDAARRAQHYRSVVLEPSRPGQSQVIDTISALSLPRSRRRCGMRLRAILS
jgi:hypothetical protein